jgi:hypothetical protein
VQLAAFGVSLVLGLAIVIGVMIARGKGKDASEVEPVAAQAAPESTTAAAPPPSVIVAELTPTPAAAAEEPPAPAKLILELNLKNGVVTLDGKKVAQNQSHVELSVEKPGEHLLGVTAPGYQPHSQSIQLSPGLERTVALRLERARGKGQAAAKRPAATKTATTPRNRDYVIDPFGQAP